MAREALRYRRADGEIDRLEKQLQLMLQQRERLYGEMDRVAKRLDMVRSSVGLLSWEDQVACGLVSESLHG